MMLNTTSSMVTTKDHSLKFAVRFIILVDFEPSDSILLSPKNWTIFLLFLLHGHVLLQFYHRTAKITIEFTFLALGY